MRSAFKISSKLPAVLILLLAMFHNSFAQCDGKTVYAILPNTWSKTSINIIWQTYTYFFASTTATQDGDWSVFTLPSYTGSNMNIDDMSFYIALKQGYSDYDRYYIGKSFGYNINYNTNGSVPAKEGGIPCSDFGEGSVLYVYPDPENSSKTIVSIEPPYQFYLLPPGTADYIQGIPYILPINGQNVGQTKPMGIDISGCGWYKETYINEPPDEIVVGIGSTLRSIITGGRIPLANKFDSLKSNTIYYHADSDRWLTARAGIQEERNRCQYNMAALIYHTSTSANSSFSQWGDDQTNAEGVCRGYVKQTLSEDGKIQWAGNNTSCQNNSFRWLSETSFNNAFDPTSTSNVVRCYEMPFQRSASDLWEFDATYLCGDGTVDIDGKGACTGSYKIGGFYPPNLRVRTETIGGISVNYTSEYSTCIGCGTTYTGETGVLPHSCVNMWCFDRGWYGGNCASSNTGETITNSKDPSMTGDLTGLAGLPAATAINAINNEMNRVCQRPIQNGDLAGYDTTIPIVSNGTSNGPTVSGLFCFESRASFTYEKGQEFFFRGDDDIWVFINNRLVVDLGGNHAPAPGYVMLDTIGLGGTMPALVEGEKYSIDIFFCDRRGPGSNVRIASNIYFAQTSESGRDPGLYAEENGIICLQEASNSCAVLTGIASNEPICGDDLQPRLSYKLAVPGWGELELNSSNSNCNWLLPTLGTCYGGITLGSGYFSVAEDAISEDYLIEHNFELYATVSGYQSLSLFKYEPFVPPSSSSSELPSSSSSSEEEALPSSSSGEVPSSSSSIPDIYCQIGNECGLIQAELCYAFGGVEVESCTTPVALNTKLQTEKLLQYYNLKGKPLGSKKPGEVGVYIVRQNGISKLIVVK